jgi:hypothetical protein
MFKHLAFLTAVLFILVFVLSGCQAGPASGPAAAISSLSSNSSISSPVQSETPRTIPWPSGVNTSNRPKYFPTPTATINAPKVLAEVISNMARLDSLTLKSNVVSTYSSKAESYHTFSTIVWNTVSSVDLVNRKTHVSLNIDQNNTLNSGQAGYLGTTKDIYFDKDFQYVINWPFATGNYQTGNIEPAWRKKKLPAGNKGVETTFFPIMEVLRNADQSTLSFSLDKIDGQEYWTVSFSLSTSAVADWVLSQESLGGPTLSFALTPALVGRDTFVQSFKGGIFQVWIDDNNRLFEAYFAAHFAATLYKSVLPNGPGTDDVSDFVGQISFSNYNQLPAIQLPPEALNAPLLQ